MADKQQNKMPGSGKAIRSDTRNHAHGMADAFLRNHRLLHAVGAFTDQHLSQIIHKPLMRHYPPAVMIEPTNVCNLKCPLCLCGNGQLQRPKGMMPLTRFQRIVDQVQNRTGMLILWNQGEPFLNPAFYEMVEYAAERGLYTMTSTNASLELDLARIVRSGLNKIIISMDGISRQSYDSYRVNGDFELVLSNMRELIRQKKQLPGSKLKVVWQFIIMRHNEHELDEVKRLAKDMGIDRLEFKTVQIFTPEDLAFLPSDHKYSRYQSSGAAFELKTTLRNRCRRLWTQPVINWDGEMSICCYDKDALFKIGNIDHTGFRELWTGPAMQRMRSAILRNRSAFEICRNCGEGIVQHVRS